MKKIILTIALLSGIGTASAQMNDHISNIQANLGGGIHTLLYTPADGTRATGLGGVLELQYQYMFNHHLGLALGVQANTLRSTSTYNYGYTQKPVVLPGANYPADLNVHFYNWRERQNVINLSIPLQLILRAPISVTSAFQMGLGASLNHPLSASHKYLSGRYVTEAYMPQTNVTYTDMDNHLLGTYNGEKKAHALDIAPIYCALHADLGFVFNLSKTTGFYLGLYGYYSPENINPNADINTAMLDVVANGASSAFDMRSSFASDRVGVVHPLEVGIKLGLRFGCGKDVDWREIAAAEAAAAAQAEAERIAAERKAEEERIAAEQRAREEAVARARAEAEAKAKATADSIARVHAAELAKAKAQAEAEAAARQRAQAQADSLARAQADAEARARADAEARERAEAEARARAKAEQRVREEAAFVAGYKDIAYFETGKDTPIFGELNEDSWENLKNVMARYPEITVTVTGHTDNVGKPASNQALSQRRADNIKAMLVSKGIDGSRIRAIGRGDKDPIASNKTKEGRAKNRRIEITIGK